MPQVNLTPPERASEVLATRFFDVAAGMTDWIVIDPDIFAVMAGVPDCMKVDIAEFAVSSLPGSTKETLVNIVPSELYAILPVEARGDAVMMPSCE